MAKALSNVVSVMRTYLYSMYCAVLCLLVLSIILPFFFQWWPVILNPGLVRLQLSVAEVWLLTSIGIGIITGPVEVQAPRPPKKINKSFSASMEHLNESAGREMHRPD